MGSGCAVSAPTCSVCILGTWVPGTYGISAWAGELEAVLPSTPGRSLLGPGRLDGRSTRGLLKPTEEAVSTNDTTVLSGLTRVRLVVVWSRRRDWLSHVDECLRRGRPVGGSTASRVVAVSGCPHRVR